ncbi:sialin-like [Convolutriloba macropyga]|uniref:sialin-like n=1 Tax=Convolutriloba macropyga TaxID=536237 RepID=UPI003F52243F
MMLSSFVDDDEKAMLMPNLDGQTENYQQTLRGKIFSTRFKIAFFGFLGFSSLMTMRVTMSIAIVKMVIDSGSSDGSYNENCPASIDRKIANHYDGTFDWTIREQSFILAAPFYGFVFTQLFGAVLASKYGGSRTFGYTVFFKAILLTLNPLFANLGVPWLVLLRLAEGMVEGLVISAFGHLTTRWSPKLERTMFYGLSLSGCSFGLVLCYPIAGYLTNLGFLDGWPLPFFLFGVLGVIWFFSWMYVASDSPDSHPRISECERNYINELTEVNDARKHSIPWKEMLKSRPFYGFLSAVMCTCGVDYALLTGLPLYFSDVLNFDLNTNALFCALLWLCCMIGSIIASFYTDFLREQHLVTTTFIRKANQMISAVFPAIFLVAAGYAECWSELAVFFLCVAGFFFGFFYAGGYCNNVDIAPYFSGACVALATAIGSLPSSFMPIAVGLLIDDNVHSAKLWLKCFYLMGFISILGGFLFLILGSGEAQPWDNPNNDTVEKEESEEAEMRVHKRKR